MKTLVLTGLLVCLVSGAAGQPASSLSFRAGISVPILCYGRHDLSKNSFAGFARPGFQLAVGYAYRLGTNFAVATQAFLMQHPTQSRYLDAGTRQHYRVMGLLAGPRLMTKDHAASQFDFQFLAGVARAVSPRLEQNNKVLLNRHGSTAFSWSASAGFRHNLSNRSFITLRAEHTQLTPGFDQHSPEEALKGQQHIVVMNVDAGIGIKF